MNFSLSEMTMFSLKCFVVSASQEASQLLTILQGLQPPLKLDGKTIGVDYAKSARK